MPDLEMVYIKDVPWHGIGAKLDNPATAKEAIIAAGLNWQVYLQQMYIPKATGYIGVPRFAILRNDSADAMPLGYATNRYQPVQNKDCFRFFDKLVGKNKARYITAGELHKGKYIWLLAKLPDSMFIAGVDQVDQYLLLTNCHEGLHSAQVLFMPIRTCCWNTLTAATIPVKGTTANTVQARIKHKGNISWQFTKAQEVLGLASTIFKTTEEQYQALAKIPMTTVDAIKYFEELMPEPKNSQRLRRSNVRSKMFFLFEEGKGNDQPGVRGTAWAAYNAVTEYIDHAGRMTASIEKKLWYSWFGYGRFIRDEALRIALQRVV